MIHGVDFGTSNSLLVGVDKDKNIFASLDPEAKDPVILRSLLYFEDKTQVHFGELARRKYLENSLEGRLLRSFKRFLPEKSFENTQIAGRLWSLEELIARFLREMRERANLFFQNDCDSVVLGRPALFSEDAEKDRLAQDRLERAARLAGYKYIDFLPEPVAAAYSYRKQMQTEELVLVADFGGGTSDFTLLKLSQKDFVPSDVLALGGVPLAGDALEGALMKSRIAPYFGSQVEYRAPFGSQTLTMPKGLLGYLCSTAYINLLNTRENRDFLSRVKTWSLGDLDRQSMERLEILLDNQLGFSIFEQIESCKKQLSSQKQVEFSFDYPGVEIREKVSKEEFRDYTKYEIGKIFSALEETLQKAGVKAEQISRVCSTGGSAQVGLIREGLEKMFGIERLDQFRNFTAIAEGLAERGRQIKSG